MKPDELVKVNANENVLGPSPRAVAAFQSAQSESHLYPVGEESSLRQKLASVLGKGLTPEHFVTGNGSGDMLRMIAAALLRPEDKAVIAAPTFHFYEKLVRSMSGQPVLAPLCHFTVDLQQVLARITERVRLVFICNPNNPTGTIVTHAEVANFIAEVPPEVIVIFDEAYMEFVDSPDFPCMIDYLQAGHNVLITRTFSKIYGLAGLRIGYGIGRPDLMAQVRRQQLPFHSGGSTYLAASAALEDEIHIQRSLAMVRQGRAYYYQALASLGIGYLPSQGNFIFLTDLPYSAAVIRDAAMAHGVMLRCCDQFQLPDHLRITIARPQENERVIKVLQMVLTQLAEGA